MRRTAGVVGAAIGMVVVAPLVALVPQTSAGAPQRPAAAPPAAAALPDATDQIAFTDEQDGLTEVVFGGTSDGCPGCPPPPVEFPTVEHQGEASQGPLGLTFVSTVDSPDGEVYLQAAAAGVPQRLTCDTEDDSAVETHPVGNSVFLGFSGSSAGSYFADAVAFASDGDGDWDVYVAFSPARFSSGLGRVAPGWSAGAADQAARRGQPAVAAAPDACEADTEDETWQVVNVTNTDDTDELWPTWVGDDRLAYSAAGPADPDDPDPDAPRALPDLQTVNLDWGFSNPGEGSADTALAVGSSEPLTDTSDVAETQPAAMVIPESEGPEQHRIAFTTTAYRRDGSIAIVDPDEDPGEEDPDGLPDPVDLFDVPGLPPQSSEAAWSSTANATAIAFTSTANDPYGDVFVADLLTVEEEEEEEVVDPPTVESFVNLSGPGRGIGESHPTWTDPVQTESAPQRAVVFTTRAIADHVDNPAFAERYLHGDIGDALALDGGDRRVLRDEETPPPDPVPADEAGPSYSPDGEQLVWSSAPADGVRRTLMIGDADGVAPPEALLPADEQNADASDTDPVWSPDGTRVAFVRTIGSGTAGSAVWVYDLATEDAVQISADDVVDLHPTWSPDGEWLMVGRSDLIDSEDTPGVDGARRQGTGDTGEPVLYVLDSDDPTWEGQELDTCNDGCDVEGRSPAWSPVDNTIAYVDHGALRTIAIADAPGEFGWDAEDPVAVTGFAEDPDGDAVVPTESRGTIETAEDPTWFGDATEIAFSGQPVGQPDNRGIYAIEPDGSGLRLITDDRGPETEPDYAEDRSADLVVAAAVTGSPAVVGGTVMITFTVVNNGPDTAFEVALTTVFPGSGVVSTRTPLPAGCQSDGSRCDLPLLAPGESVDYLLDVSHAAPIATVATASATSTTTDPDVGNNTAPAPYEFVAPTVDHADVAVRIRPDRQVGYVGGAGAAKIVVRNRGPVVAEEVTLDVVWPDELTLTSDPLPASCLSLGATCELGDLDPGDRVVAEVTFTYDTAGRRLPVVAEVATTTVELTAENNRDRARVTIRQPELRVLPAVAKPGQVVLAYGEKLPPGTEIEIGWSVLTPGGDLFGGPITVDPGPFVIAEDGTIRIPLLVLRRDDLGPRILTAASTTAEFTDLETDLLVVPRTLGPPLFAGRG